MKDHDPPAISRTRGDRDASAEEDEHYHAHHPPNPYHAFHVNALSL
jgi:hypothetical protein